MGAPKIKIYQIPAGYSQNTDSDIQQATNDELIPVRDKPVTPEDFYPLTGIKQISGESLLSIDFESGLITASLSPNSVEFQIPSGLSGYIFYGQSGDSFTPVVLDEELEEIAPSGYQITASGVRFLSAPYPSGASIKYWKSGSFPTRYMVGSHDSWYNGTNHMFRPYVSEDPTPSGYLSGSDYELVAPSGLVIFVSPMPSGYARYYYESTMAKMYIGHHENWVPPNSANMDGGHLYMGPDVFKGMYDYPGDDSPGHEQGEIPQYVEQDQYQIDFRKGLVTFNGSEFDNTVYPVYASFAYLTGVRNVEGQILKRIAAASGQYVYAASTDTDPRSPLSVGARWIGRDNPYTPVNFYIDGELSLTVTVNPPDVLGVK